MKKLIIFSIITIIFLAKASAEVSGKENLSSECAIENAAASCDNSSVKAFSKFNVNTSFDRLHQSINLKINSASYNYAIVNVTDMTGRTVMVSKVNVATGANEVTLNATKFSKGLYNVQVITSNTSKASRIII